MGFLRFKGVELKCMQTEIEGNLRRMFDDEMIFLHLVQKNIFLLGKHVKGTIYSYIIYIMHLVYVFKNLRAEG